MNLTFGEARELLAKYAGKSGKCSESKDVALFVQKVLQTLIYHGANGNLRKWEFYTQNGTFTAPPDLETPVKMSINGKVGAVYDKFYEFYDQSTLAQCFPCEQGLVEEINPFYTQYDIPTGGAHILVKATCKEAEDAHVIISGVNTAGQEVRLPHKGLIQNGEYVGISKEQPQYSQEKFVKVTGIEKTVTQAGVKLYWYCPETGKQGLLAEYKSVDTFPSFRRFRVNNISCEDCYKVTILGRIQIARHYEDTDIIPISNIRALELTAQQMQAEANNDSENAITKEQSVERSITHENQYKRPPVAPVNFFHATSPGSMKPMI